MSDFTPLGDGLNPAKLEANIFSIVQFVRAHLPDINENDEQEVASSDLTAFHKAMEKLKISFSESPVLGFEDIGDGKISAWLSTNDPKILVRATRAITEREFTPRFYSMHLMGENKVQDLKTRIQPLLPQGQPLDVSKLLSK